MHRKHVSLLAPCTGKSLSCTAHDESIANSAYIMLLFIGGCLRRFPGRAGDAAEGGDAGGPWAAVPDRAAAACLLHAGRAGAPCPQRSHLCPPLPRHLPLLQARPCASMLRMGISIRTLADDNPCKCVKLPPHILERMTSHPFLSPFEDVYSHVLQNRIMGVCVALLVYPTILVW